MSVKSIPLFIVKQFSTDEFQVKQLFRKKKKCLKKS